jgi:hypothetical protein
VQVGGENPLAVEEKKKLGPEEKRAAQAKKKEEEYRALVEQKTKYHLKRLAGYQTKSEHTAAAQVEQETRDKMTKDADNEGLHLAFEVIRQRVITVIFSSFYAMCTHLIG